MPSASLPPEDPEPIAPNQPLIGVIDTGFAVNNPDIDYSRIILGQDWVDGDDNPLLEIGEGDEHGTLVLGLIGATNNNVLGIEGINDKAPLWLGRAIGSGEWAESLVEFVDASLESEQSNAVVNLSLDLTDINPDGSVSTRLELIPEERAALEYARQNNVLVVVSAGNDGDAMSALGQASQEFDNIITVGSSEGTERSAYSSYGYGLNLLAPGGTAENPVESILGDGVGTLSGTSVATALVTGAASQVWAANPDLNYTQVVEVLESTGEDLNSPGWDLETGAGLLNMEAAIALAETTTAEDYSSLGEELLQGVLDTYQIPEVLQPAFSQIYSWVNLDSVLPEPTQEEAENPTASERPTFLDDIVDTVTDTVGDVVDTVTDTVGDAVDTATDFVSDLGDSFTGFLDGLGDYNIWDSAADVAGNWWDTATTWVADSLDTATDMASNWWNDTSNQVAGALGSIDQWWDSVEPQLGSIGTEIGSAIANAFGAVGTIGSTNDLFSLGGLGNGLVGNILNKPQGASKILSGISTVFRVVQETPELLWIAIEPLVGDSFFDANYDNQSVLNNFAPLDANGNVPLSGTISTWDGNYPIKLWEYDSNGRSEPQIDPNQETVVVIHGWNRNKSEHQPDGFKEELAITLAKDPNLQVLAVDWGEAAIDSSLLGKAIPLLPARRIRPVAEWTARTLNQVGLDPQQITLLGHSLGSYVGAEVGRIFGGVKNLVAMEAAFPAKFYDIDGQKFGPQRLTDFDRVATNSLAFFAGHSFLSGGLAGDAPQAATAEDSFPIRFKGGNIITRIWKHHSNVVSVVEDAFDSGYLIVPDLTLPDHQDDWYGHRSQKLDSPDSGHHEGVVRAVESGDDWIITALNYVDASGEEQTTWTG